MNYAVNKEINREYILAVECYENSIKEGNATIEDYINLAFIYWSFATEQMEFNIPNNIPDKWSLIGGERFSIIIDEGLLRYPNSLELKFWDKYFSYRLYGNVFSQQECWDLIKKHDEDLNLAPYFFLHLFDKSKYTNEIFKLTIICNNNPTAKNLYIESFIK